MSAVQTESLCWSCRNSVPDRYGNGCSWSRDQIPVGGWQADYKKKHDSWHVISCPEYDRDPPEMIRPDMDTDTEAVDRLRTAIMKQAASDYARAIRLEAKRTKGSALERQLRRLYDRDRTWRLYRFRRIPGSVTECERFFVSEYARILIDGDPDYIMTEIQRMEKDAYAEIRKRKELEHVYRKRSKRWQKHRSQQGK